MPVPGPTSAAEPPRGLTPGLTRRGLATRSRIVSAAADLVFEHGVAGTSMDDVMASSGTSKSQIYHYFADKDALVEAVIEAQTGRVRGTLAPYLDQADPIEGLRRWCAAVVDLQRSAGCIGGCPVGSLASELSDSSESARLLLEASFTRWQADLEIGLTLMRDRGHLVDGADPSALAVAVMVALQGGLLLAKTTRSIRPLEEGLTMAVAHVERHTRT